MVCGTGVTKGTKRSRPGVQFAKMNEKTIPPESEIRNIQSSGKRPSKTEMITDKKGRERSTGGQVETLYSLWNATRNGEAIILGIGVRGRQKAKHYLTRQLMGIHGTNGAAGGVHQSRLL